MGKDAQFFEKRKNGLVEVDNILAYFIASNKSHEPKNGERKQLVWLNCDKPTQPESNPIQQNPKLGLLGK